MMVVTLSKPALDLFAGLTFRLARAAEQGAALHLRREIYEAELKHHGIDDFDLNAKHLVAFDNQGAPIAVTRVITPEQRPFELEEYVDLAARVPNGVRIAQIGGLAIRRDYRNLNKGSAVSIGLLKLSLLLAEELEFSDYVLWALPHLRAFYKSAFFEDVTGPIQHSLWGPLWLMHLDLVQFRTKAKTARSPLLLLLLEKDPAHFPPLGIR